MHPVSLQAYSGRCSSRDQGLGLEAPRGQKIVLVLTKKSSEFQDFLLANAVKYFGSILISYGVK